MGRQLVYTQLRASSILALGTMDNGELRVLAQSILDNTEEAWNITWKIINGLAEEGDIEKAAIHASLCRSLSEAYEESGAKLLSDAQLWWIREVCEAADKFTKDSLSV